MTRERGRLARSAAGGITARPSRCRQDGSAWPALPAVALSRCRDCSTSRKESAQSAQLGGAGEAQTRRPAGQGKLGSVLLGARAAPLLLSLTCVIHAAGSAHRPLHPSSEGRGPHGLPSLPYKYNPGLAAACLSVGHETLNRMDARGAGDPTQPGQDTVGVVGTAAAACASLHCCFKGGQCWPQLRCEGCYLCHTGPDGPLQTAVRPLLVAHPSPGPSSPREPDSGWQRKTGPLVLVAAWQLFPHGPRLV